MEQNFYQQNENIFEIIVTVSDEVITLFNEKNYDACVRECEDILNVNPQNGIALLYMSIINQEWGNHRVAVQYFSRLYDVAPLFFYGRDYKGRSHLELHEGDKNAALASYMQSQVIAPQEEKYVTAKKMYKLFAPDRE